MDVNVANADCEKKSELYYHDVLSGVMTLS